MRERNCFVWCGVVWCGVVWCGVVWCAVVWEGVAEHIEPHQTVFREDHVCETASSFQ